MKTVAVSKEITINSRGGRVTFPGGTSYTVPDDEADKMVATGFAAIIDGPPDPPAYTFTVTELDEEASEELDPGLDIPEPEEE